MGIRKILKKIYRDEEAAQIKDEIAKQSSEATKTIRFVNDTIRRSAAYRLAVATGNIPHE